MSYLKLATIVISLYVLIESFCAIAKMPGGLIHFCHKIKYTLAFSSSLVFIFYSVTMPPYVGETWDWLLFGSTGTLALFVWPRTVHRLKAHFKMIEDIEANFL